MSITEYGVVALEINVMGNVTSPQTSVNLSRSDLTSLSSLVREGIIKLNLLSWQILLE